MYEAHISGAKMHDGIFHTIKVAGVTGLNTKTHLRTYTTQSPVLINTEVLYTVYIQLDTNELWKSLWVLSQH